MTLFRLFLLACLLSLTACGNDADKALQAKFDAFGTEIDVSLYGVDEATADKTVSLLETSFSSVNETWNAWHPSVLMTINQAISEGKTITVTEDVAALIEQAKSLSIASNNLFNPAAGKLFQLWGFYQDDWFVSHPPPSEAEIQNWLTNIPTMADIHINNNQVSSDNLMAKLGFGGFAKGYAVDSAITILQNLGITNAIVNIGGDLRAIGSHGQRPWIIGIRHPRKDGMMASIALKGDESVFTSGDYERFFDYEGVRYPHILDPRTGLPARDAISVTVLHNNAAEADAAATALVVAGKDWPKTAQLLGVDRVMLVRQDGQIEISPKMVKRVRLINNATPPIIRDIEKQTP